MEFIASDANDVPRLVKTLTTRELCVALYGLDTATWRAVKVNSSGELVVNV